MILFSSFIISIIATILLMPILINLACRLNVLDFPNSRKIHCDPVPRIGGVAMALGACIPILVWAPMDKFVAAVLMGSAIVVIFGLIDDIRDIGFKTKFAGQALAAIIVILYGGLEIKSLGMFAPKGFLMPGWVSIPLTLVIIVAVTNAINLSDGLDGLAGGITLLSFLCIGYLSYLDELQAFKIISIAMIGAIFGLLRYNTHPATVFMGDAGSQLLGFLSITLSLGLTRGNNQINLVLVLLILGIPVLDTLLVIITRIFKGRSPFAADKSHLHYRIMNLGFFHSESVLILYILQGIFVSLGFVFRYAPAWVLLGLYLLLSGSLIYAISLAEFHEWKIKRYRLIDKIIKKRLRKLKQENVIIKISFKAVEIGFIFLLIFTCFLPRSMHIYFSLSSAVFLILMLVVWNIKKEWKPLLVEISLFMMIPFLVYLSETDISYLRGSFLIKAYSYSFGVLILFVFLTLKFTRRNGFKTNPMDILIILIALVIPNLPDQGIRSWQLGLVAAKIIVFYFTYEIIKGELRLDKNRLEVACIASLLIIAARGFVG